MSGIADFLRNYHFLDFTKSVTEAQMALYKKPDQTWAQIGSKFYNICWYNGKAISAVGFDVITYLGVSALHGCNLFCPPPSAPPMFSSPLDNVQFIQYAVQRALWNWDPALKREMQEGIADSLSDKWNVFQVIGEWSIAYSFENAHKSSFYKPTFLTTSESLANGESFRNVGAAFASLRQTDKTEILEALYHQKDSPSLGFSAKKVYQNIRSLASKLQQGNGIYLTSYGDYVRKKASGVLQEPIPLADQPTVGVVLPSAPPLPGVVTSVEERRILADVEFLHRSLKNPVIPLDSYSKTWLVKLVINDQTPLMRSWNSLEAFMNCAPESSPKYFVARLVMLHFFKEFYQKNKRSEFPNFITWNERLDNGKTLRETGSEFAQLSDRDFVLIQKAILDPRRSSLGGHLREKLYELSVFANQLQRNQNFLRIYEALRIDLVAV